MLLEFNNKNINEFKLGGTGHFHFTNDGKPFEVSDLVGNELLTETASVDGEMVKVFKVSKPAESEPQTAASSTPKKGVK